MVATYKVIFRGEISESSDRGKIEPVLAKFFKIPVAKANLLFNGKAYALKKGLDVDNAIAVQQKLLGIGVITRLIREETLVDDITYQESEPLKVETHTKTAQAPLDRIKSIGLTVVERAKQYWAWTKTPKGKKVSAVIGALAITAHFAQNYFADCDSPVSRIAFKKALSKGVSSVTQLADDQFDIDINGIVQLQFDQAQSIYVCKANVVVTDMLGNAETEEIVYQVVKRGMAKPKVQIR